MPLFEYQAYDGQGRARGGVIEAPTQTAAYQKVREQGLFPSQIKEEDVSGAAGRSKPENVAFALIQLATLLRAGIPLPQSIEALVQQVPDRALQRALAAVHVKLQEGASFADALKDNPVFGDLLSKLVSAGESVGQLEVLLEEYARFIERGQEYRNRIAGALAYPVVVLLASMALVFFVLTNVTPTLARIYSNFRMEMPLPTQILLKVGGFLSVAWPYLLGLFVIALYVWLRVVPRRTRDGTLLKVPILGAVLGWTQIARWARTVALLHRGGVPLVRALRSAREVVENAELAETLAPVDLEVERGVSLGAALRRLPSIPPLIAQMAETGERSGELDSLMVAAAEFYEKEADRRLQGFIRLLEPAMIVFMGGAVGFVVMAVLLPIFDINQVIR